MGKPSTWKSEDARSIASVADSTCSTVVSPAPAEGHSAPHTATAVPAVEGRSKGKAAEGKSCSGLRGIIKRAYLHETATRADLLAVAERLSVNGPVATADVLVLVESYAERLRLQPPSSATAAPAAAINCPRCAEAPTERTAQLDADMRRAIRDELQTFRDELLRDIADVVTSVVWGDAKRPDSQ